MSTIYALLTRRCNLTCPYCDVKDVNDNYDHEKFINVLRSFNGGITLFGGEPTLYRDRLKSVLYDPGILPKVMTITTNLMIMDDEMIQIFKDCKTIGTSWNPSRFNEKEYETWKKHLSMLSGHLRARVLVTMTFDLLRMDPSDVVDIIATWDNTAIRDVVFENLIDDRCDDKYFEKVDNWLCELYDAACEKKLVVKFTTNMGDQLIRCFDCSQIYHLEPDGTVKPGCPHTGKHVYVPDACYSCDLAGECRPCRLQRYCSFPKKFHNKLLLENNQ